MDNQKIPTSTGAVILIIIAITIGVFVWVYEQKQGSSVTIQTPTVSKPNTKVYTSEKYGFVFKFPGDLTIDPNSKDSDIILNNPLGEQRVIYIQIYGNNDMDKAFDEYLLQLRNPDQKNNVILSNINIDGNSAKKYSIENYTDYGNTWITLNHNKNIIRIFGDDSTQTNKANLETVLNSFVFTK